MFFGFLQKVINVMSISALFQGTLKAERPASEINAALEENNDYM